MKGVLEIQVTIDIYPKCFTLQQNFIMIYMALAYNVIIVRLLLHNINAVINTVFGLEIFYSEGGSYREMKLKGL